jgi:hypothetical protein
VPVSAVSSVSLSRARIILWLCDSGMNDENQTAGQRSNDSARRRSEILTRRRRAPGTLRAVDETQITSGAVPCRRRGLKPGLRKIIQGIDMPRGGIGRGLDVNEGGKRHGRKGCGQQQKQYNGFDAHSLFLFVHSPNAPACDPFP